MQASPQQPRVQPSQQLQGQPEKCCQWGRCHGKEWWNCSPRRCIRGGVRTWRRGRCRSNLPGLGGASRWPWRTGASGRLHPSWGARWCATRKGLLRRVVWLTSIRAASSRVRRDATSRNATASVTLWLERNICAGYVDARNSAAAAAGPSAPAAAAAATHWHEQCELLASGVFLPEIKGAGERWNGRGGGFAGDRGILNDLARNARCAVSL